MIIALRKIYVYYDEYLVIRNIIIANLLETVTNLWYRVSSTGACFLLVYRRECYCIYVLEESNLE